MDWKIARTLACSWMILVGCQESSIRCDSGPAFGLRGTTSVIGHSGNYALVDLGLLSGVRARGVAVNDSRQVAGYAEIGDGNVHAVVWDGSFRDLGTFGGRDSWATDINNQGIVVGGAEMEDGLLRAFLWDGSEMANLGVLHGEVSFAQAITEEGRVFGGGPTFPYVWDGEWHSLPVALSPNDVNELGAIAGFGNRKSPGPFVPLLWDGDWIELGAERLGVWGHATAVNNMGEVVGFMVDCEDPRCIESHLRAFRWKGGLRELEGYGLGARANDLNDLGQVVGWARLPTGERRAVLWDDGIHELGTLGGENSAAEGINGLGEITGFAETSGGEEHAVLWKILTPQESIQEIRDFLRRKRLDGWTLPGFEEPVDRTFMAISESLYRSDSALAQESLQGVVRALRKSMISEAFPEHRETGEEVIRAAASVFCSLRD